MASNRAINSGRNVQALKVKAPATPIAPISAAANMGPQSLAILNCTEFSARARAQFRAWNQAGHDRKEDRAVEGPDDPLQKRKDDNDPGRRPPQERCHGKSRTKHTRRRLQRN